MNVSHTLELLASRDFISLFFFIMSLFAMHLSIVFSFLAELSLSASKYCITQGIFMSRLKTLMQHSFCLQGLYEFAQFLSYIVGLQVMASGEQTS